MTLRARLILAFATFALLLALVGLGSFLIHRHIRSEVAALRSGRGVDLRHIDVEGSSLELEGFWDRSGTFVATDVEALPGTRRPKLRGEIQAIDLAARTVTLYGTPIHVAEETEFLGLGAGSLGLEDLRPGQRIEVSCRIDGGRWTARKVKTRNIKQSDKIKGTPIAVDLDGKAPERVEFPGLVVSLAQPTGDSPRGAWRRIELATQMTLLLQESRAAAHELVGRTLEWSDPDGATELDRDTLESSAADERLARAERDFEYFLEQSQRDSADAAGAGPSAFAPWLRALSDRRAAFRERVETLLGLSRSDPERARAFLDEVFDPFLQDDLLPGLYAYRGSAEDALADQLHAMELGAAATTRVALATSAVAAVLALVLGALLWRSIRTPIRALEAAALRLGQGQLDTRVDVQSRDELGVLAETFNKMARDLSGTTVSMRRLERVLAEKELLLRELHHRVKNNMQVVSSLLAIQASYASDPKTREQFEQAQCRIRSMALIHEQLYQTKADAEVDLRSYLELLTVHLLRSSAGAHGASLELSVEASPSDISQAVACGLIVNELVTNALKHAFPDGKGRIRLSLHDDGAGNRVLSVGDDGRGPARPGASDAVQGVGLALVEQLVKHLRGRMAWSAGPGREVTIVFPTRPGEPLVAAS